MARLDPWLFVGLLGFFGLLLLALFGERLALESVGVHDAAGLIFSGVVLAGLFATVSALADVSRPRALFPQSS
jgi:hypothetical protein